MIDPDDGVDLAVAAFRSDGEWRVEEVTHTHLGDLESLASGLRRFPGDGGALAMVAIDEDFFILVRVEGAETRVLLSDLTAATDWDLAASVVEHLGLPLPEDEDEPGPVGQLDLFSDLGVPADELSELIDDLLDDEELFPDEMLSDVARLLGFGELFDDLAGLTSA